MVLSIQNRVVCGLASSRVLHTKFVMKETSDWLGGNSQYRHLVLNFVQIAKIVVYISFSAPNRSVTRHLVLDVVGPSSLLNIGWWLFQSSCEVLSLISSAKFGDGLLSLTRPLSGIHHLISPHGEFLFNINAVLRHLLIHQWNVFLQKTAFLRVHRPTFCHDCELICTIWVDFFKTNIFHSSLPCQRCWL